ncbi:hypothetical protein Droror1_Dr00004246 [Drosera rotundifolia]
MTMPAKNKAVTSFNEDPEYRIFLTKLQAGSVALNLTVASHVFLMEPAWNAAVEQQAINWIHRIGQHKPIKYFDREIYYREHCGGKAPHAVGEGPNAATCIVIKEIPR